jgi:hypothetical protein
MVEQNPFYGATFAERRAIREAAEQGTADVEPKRVDKDAYEVEDKAVTSAQTKKRTSSKSSARKG